VYRIMQGARARWRIENETFNTLKNQGYHFEHNFGHGYDLNVAPTEPWSPWKPHKVTLSGHQASARAWRSASL